MAIIYVGGQTAAVTAVTPTTQTVTFALTGGSASTPAAGDLVLISYNDASNGDAVLSGRISTSGYTLITELYANDTYDANMAVFRKFMGGTPDTSVVVVGTSGTATGCVVNIRVFRGVDSTTPLDATTTTATGIDTGFANPPAITPVTSGNVLIAFGMAATSSGSSGVFTAPTDLTDFIQQARGSTTYRAVSGSAYLAGQAANVSFNPAAWTLAPNSTTNSWAAATLALRPSATVPIDGSATSTVTSSVSAAAAITAAGSATASVTSSTVASATVTSVYVDASATATVTSGATSVAYRISNAAAAIDVTSDATAAGLLVYDASATSAAASSVTASAALTASGQATASADSAATVSAVTEITAAATASVESSAAAMGVAVVRSSAATTIYAITSASGVRKWEADAPQGEIWTTQNDTDEIWTPATTSPAIWS